MSRKFVQYKKFCTLVYTCFLPINNSFLQESCKGNTKQLVENLSLPYNLVENPRTYLRVQAVQLVGSLVARLCLGAD
jgi:hypothetical protein